MKNYLVQHAFDNIAIKYKDKVMANESNNHIYIYVKLFTGPTDGYEDLNQVKTLLYKCVRRDDYEDTNLYDTFVCEILDKLSPDALRTLASIDMTYTLSKYVNASSKLVPYLTKDQLDSHLFRLMVLIKKKYLDDPEEIKQRYTTLIKHGADINRPHNGKRLLTRAISSIPLHKVAKLLLDTPGIEVNYVDQDNTPLEMAYGLPDLCLVRKLMHCGANVESVQDYVLSVEPKHRDFTDAYLLEIINKGISLQDLALISIKRNKVNVSILPPAFTFFKTI